MITYKCKDRNNYQRKQIAIMVYTSTNHVVEIVFLDEIGFNGGIVFIDERGLIAD